MAARGWCACGTRDIWDRIHTWARDQEQESMLVLYTVSVLDFALTPIPPSFSAPKSRDANCQILGASPEATIENVH